jgi:hypothetical protein
MHRHTTRQQQSSKPELTKSAQQPGVESRSKVTFHDTQSGEVREVSASHLFSAHTHGKFENTL